MYLTNAFLCLGCPICLIPLILRTLLSLSYPHARLHLSFALHLAVVVLEHIALAALFVDACDLETLLCSNCIVLCFFFDGVVLLYQELLSALVLLLSSFADLFPCLFWITLLYVVSISVRLSFCRWVPKGKRKLFPFPFFFCFVGEGIIHGNVKFFFFFFLISEREYVC